MLTYILTLDDRIIYTYIEFIIIINIVYLPVLFIYIAVTIVFTMQHVIIIIIIE